MADEMEIEDGVIGFHVFREEGVAASTEFGMDNLLEVGRIDNEDPAWLKHWQPQ
ncbi:hypothetical protein [Bradyrhizobium sp. 25ACV]